MSNPKISFSEFEIPDFTTWKEKVIADLKGKDYNVLIQKTDEEIDIEAIIPSERTTNNHPDTIPFTRGNKEENNDWVVFQSYTESDPKELNKTILADLNKGVSGVQLNLEDYSAINQITENIKLEHISTAFTVKNADQACNLLKDLPENTVGWLDYNPISKDSLIGIDEVLNYTKKRSTLKAFNIDGAHIRNLGANITDEIAFLLSCGNEYLNHFQFTGLDFGLVAENIMLTTGIGPNYFFEIAKVRAIRKLWANMVAQYHPDSKEDYKIYIHAKTLSLNLHEEDSYNNLLRQTTEGMSATIGGVESLEVVPFQGADADENELFVRMTRNIQLILKEESMMNQVIDPAGGSYYIEALTEELSKRAWAKFQEMEAQGGYIEVFDQFMHELVAKRTDYLNKVENGEKIRVGVNKYTTEKA
jgi:methylmalonyl-CoA mutase